MDEILELLRQNARLSAEDIYAMTKKSVDEVKAAIKKLEDDGVILKYAAIVNPEKDRGSKDKVVAEIQIQVQHVENVPNRADFQMLRDRALKGFPD